MFLSYDRKVSVFCTLIPQNEGKIKTLCLQLLFDKVFPRICQLFKFHSFHLKNLLFFRNVLKKMAQETGVETGS